MKKNIRKLLLCLILAFSMVGSISATDVNVDSEDGNQAGAAYDQFLWYRTAWGNDDGVRVSVVDIEEGRICGTLDFANKSHDGYYWFDGIPKLYYTTSSTVSLVGGYSNVVLSGSDKLPWVMKGDGSTNGDAIKEYFSDEGRLQNLADEFNIDFEELTSGKYKLLLEPVLYATISQKPMAVTATQAALYDKGNARILYRLGPNVIHSILPSAMFLVENDNDLGLIARSPTSGYQDNDYIINYLGVGVVSFTPPVEEEEDVIPPVGGEFIITPGEDEYTYRTNTDVYTTVIINPSEDITFNDGGIRINMKYVSNRGTTTDLCTTTIEAPKGKDQLAYCKWSTPNKADSGKVHIYYNGTKYLSIPVTIQDLSKNTPPDTNADDKKPTGWNVPSIGSDSTSGSISWTEYYSVKQTDIKTAEGTPGGWDYTKKITYTYSYTPPRSAHCSISGNSTSATCEEAGGTWYSYRAGYYTQIGSTTTYENIKNYYKFYKFGSHTQVSSNCTGSHSNGNRVCTYDYEGKENFSQPYKYNYTVNFTSSTSVSNDVNNPTAKPGELKSGYGVEVTTTNSVRSTGSNPTSEYTTAQTGIASYPEWKFSRYWDLMDGTTRMTLPISKHSLLNARVHYTPIWYPDNKKYPVQVKVMDIWTPAGMLSGTSYDYLTINGSMWDDYHVSQQ